MCFKLHLDELVGKFVMHDKLTQNFSRKIPAGRRVFEKSKCKWQAVTFAPGLTLKTVQKFQGGAHRTKLWKCCYTNRNITG
jgi:hypothetical protein